MENVMKRVNIKRGDTVVVIAGKSRGKKGKVLEVSPEDNSCVVEGVNIVIKHKKARAQGQKSSRDKRAGRIDISNVMILCKCGKATRVGHKMVGDKKVRVCAKCDEVLDKKYVKVKDKAKEVEGEEIKEKEEKVDRKPLQRREVKHTADSKIKKPDNKAAGSSVALPRKMGTS